jgi:hypothetical protein
VTTSQCLSDPNNPGSPTLSCGLGSFALTVSWDPAKLDFVNFSDGGFLGKHSPTGREDGAAINSCNDGIDNGPDGTTDSMDTDCKRSVSCPIETSTESSATFSCVTFGAMPPGPQGTGTLAVLQLHPLVAGPGGTDNLSLSDVVLTDIAGNEFPGPATGGSVEFDPCFANIAPSNTQIDFQDVLVLMQHFGEEPPSLPRYDPSGDNKVTFTDVIYILRLFGVQCTP